MNPSTCFSVSLICVTATRAGALVGKLAKTTAIAAMVRRSIWYMAEPPHVAHPAPPQAAAALPFALAPRRAHLAIGCSPVAAVSLLYGLAVDCVVQATGSNHLPVPDGSNISSGRQIIGYRNQSEQIR